MLHSLMSIGTLRLVPPSTIVSCAGSLTDPLLDPEAQACSAQHVRHHELTADLSGPPADSAGTHAAAQNTGQGLGTSGLTATMIHSEAVACTDEPRGDGVARQAEQDEKPAASNSYRWVSWTEVANAAGAGGAVPLEAAGAAEAGARAAPKTKETGAETSTARPAADAKADERREEIHSIDKDDVVFLHEDPVGKGFLWAEGHVTDNRPCSSQWTMLQTKRHRPCYRWARGYKCSGATGSFGLVYRVEYQCEVKAAKVVGHISAPAHSHTRARCACRSSICRVLRALSASGLCASSTMN